jgi:hypothetical protein
MGMWMAANRPACAFFFFICFTDYAFTEVSHEPTDVIKTLTVNCDRFFKANRECVALFGTFDSTMYLDKVDACA